MNKEDRVAICAAVQQFTANCALCTGQILGILYQNMPNHDWANEIDWSPALLPEERSAISDVWHRPPPKRERVPVVRVEHDAEVVEESTALCWICGAVAPVSQMVTFRTNLIGRNCCWDERLRATE